MAQQEQQNRCNQCGKTFNSQEELRQHEKTQHQGQAQAGGQQGQQAGGQQGQQVRGAGGGPGRQSGS